MRISISLLPQLSSGDSTAEIAVVIDVLRATSVMATALHAGASRIVTCRGVSEARVMADQLSPRPLLCGERRCAPIEGFDLGNSPAEYQPARVEGRTLVLTTTNGTHAIEAAASAERMVTASFLNLSAVIDSLRGFASVHLVCAGTEGEVTAEDVLLAGAIACECETRYQAVTADDQSMLACQLWRSWFPAARNPPLPDPIDLGRRLRETRGGKNLLARGYPQDLDRCAAIDTAGVVPERTELSPTIFELQAK